MVSLSVSISLIQHGALWYRAKHHQPGRWVPLQEDAADESQNDWDEELSIHLQPFKPDDSNQPQVVILADGQITPFSLLMANAGTGEPLLTLVCSGSWPPDQTLARDTRP